MAELTHAESNAPDQSLIYHYCSAESFMAILQYKTLRLSNCFFSNDSMEHFWLRDLAWKFIQERHPHSTVYAGLHKILTERGLADYYITCFSKQHDLLSQWIAYADNGAGFAIGFDPYFFVHEFRKRWRQDIALNLELRKVVYDENEQWRMLEKCFVENPDGEEERHHATLQINAVDTIYQLACTCKNPAFHQEDEWRIIHNPEVYISEGLQTEDAISKFKYRVKNGNLVPFLELKLEQPDNPYTPIKEIGIGPRNPCRFDNKFLKYFLAQYGWMTVGLYNSGATYQA